MSKSSRRVTVIPIKAVSLDLAIFPFQLANQKPLRVTIIIISGTIIYQLTVAPIHGEPTGASKLNTVFQILFILLAITHAWLGQPHIIVLRMLGVAILTTIAISTVQYVTTGFSRRRAHRST